MRARILIVDDDPDTALALSGRVTWMGHEALTASDGKEALRLIKREQPDLVLLDIVIPFFSGFEVLQRINDTEGISVKPVVIMTTGFASNERAAEAKRLGAVDFITKPCTGDHITSVINNALATISQRREVSPQKHSQDSGNSV